MDGAHVDEPRRLRRVPRHHDPVRRLPGDQQPISPPPTPRRCRGCSTPTRSRLPRCSSRSVASPTASAGAARSSPPSSCSPSPRCCAGWPRSVGCADRGSSRSQAVGAAALVPSSLALVLQTFPRDKIPVAVAIWGAIGAVAGAAGSDARRVRRRAPQLAVGVLRQPAGRHRQLRCSVDACCPKAARRTRDVCPIRSAWCCWPRGLALAALRASCRPTTGGGRAPASPLCSAAAALLVAVFIWRCRRVSNPLLDLSLFRANNFRWANAAHARLFHRLQRDVPRQRAVPHDRVEATRSSRPDWRSRSAR